MLKLLELAPLWRRKRVNFVFVEMHREKHDVATISVKARAEAPQNCFLAAWKSHKKILHSKAASEPENKGPLFARHCENFLTFLAYILS
jgi:hypothetical protein